MELNEITRLLFDFQKMPNPKKERTFLEISGYPHYENVCSNILQFFLDPKNEHGFKDLVLNSIVQLVEKGFKVDCDFEEIRVHREFHTLGQNRIDLIVETNKYVIGIENKVFHFLNNDLNDYSNTISNLCVHNDRIPINIILSLNNLLSNQDRKKAEINNFHCITYEEVFVAINKSIGKYLTSSHPSYTIYLLDFIKSIQNLKSSTMENRVLWNFFKENSEVVQELFSKYNDYKNDLFSKPNKVLEFLPKEIYAPLVKEQWIWNGKTENMDNFFALVHDYLIEGFKISIDATIGIKEWEIKIFGRDDSDTNYLYNHMLFDAGFITKPIKFNLNDRFLIQKFDSDVELEQVANALKEILKRVENFKKQKEDNPL